MKTTLIISPMKKAILTALFLTVGLLAWSQTRKDTSPQSQQEQKDDQRAKRAAESDFHNKKAQEAKDKQEAKRKAMKERARNKQEIEKSR